VGNETFSKTLEIQLFSTDNFYTITGKTKEPKFITLAKETIYVFQTYGAFLDNVPIRDRKEFNNEIIKWICSVYDDLSRIDKNKIYARASDKKTSDLKAINHVIDIVGCLPEGLEDAEKTYFLLQELHNAIKNDNQKKVLHVRYYRTPLTTKKPMENIIKKMVKVHGITRVKTLIQTLVEKLPTYKSIV